MIDGAEDQSMRSSEPREINLGAVAAGLLVSVLLLAASGCAQPFASPEIIAGSEDSLTVASGRFNQPDSFAEEYCAQYGKVAIYEGGGPLNDTEVTDIYYYECEDPEKVSAPESE